MVLCISIEPDGPFKPHFKKKRKKVRNAGPPLHFLRSFELPRVSLPSPQTRDAFIAATGCIAGETRTLQENALALARMALAMQEICLGLTAPDGSPVVMRIGLHCGPLVAGVVGGSMLRYHLFGPAMDAVTQARMVAAIRIRIFYVMLRYLTLSLV